MSGDKWNVIDENGATTLPDFASIPMTEWGFARAAITKQLKLPKNFFDREWRAAHRAAAKDVKEIQGGAHFGSRLSRGRITSKALTWLTEIQRSIDIYLVAPAGTSEIMALWIVASHAFDCFRKIGKRILLPIAALERMLQGTSDDRRLWDTQAA